MYAATDLELDQIERQQRFIRLAARAFRDAAEELTLKHFRHGMDSRLHTIDCSNENIEDTAMPQRWRVDRVLPDRYEMDVVFELDSVNGQQYHYMATAVDRNYRAAIQERRYATT